MKRKFDGIRFHIRNSPKTNPDSARSGSRTLFTVMNRIKLSLCTQSKCRLVGIIEIMNTSPVLTWYLYFLASQIGAQLMSNLCSLTCLRHLIRPRAVTNRIFFLRKDRFSLVPSNISTMRTYVNIDKFKLGGSYRGRGY